MEAAPAGQAAPPRKSAATKTRAALGAGRGVSTAFTVGNAAGAMGIMRYLDAGGTYAAYFTWLWSAAGLGQATSHGAFSVSFPRPSRYVAATFRPGGRGWQAGRAPARMHFLSQREPGRLRAWGLGTNSYSNAPRARHGADLAAGEEEQGEEEQAEQGGGAVGGGGGGGGP